MFNHDIVLEVDLKWCSSKQRSAGGSLFEKKKLFASVGVGTFFSEDLVKMEFVKFRILLEILSEFKNV